MPLPGPDTASLLSARTDSTSGRGTSVRGGTIFQLDTFSNKDFIVRDFVETLSDSAIPASRRSGAASTQAFDPKPLIRTFEHALSRLATLSEEHESHESELSGAVRRAESQHNQNLDTLGQKLEQTIDSFHQLDSSLNGGGGYGDGVGGDGASGGGAGDVSGSNAIRIGERLEELDRQRQRAQDAKFLIQCWLEVSERGDLSSLEDVRRLGGGDGKVRCAHIARQLLRISHRLDPDVSRQVNGEKHMTNGANGEKPQRQKPREVIEKFLEMLEKDLLKQFDDFYRRQNFNGMRECAVALRDFSDGASVMALFVNQHQFFIDRSQLITEEVAGEGETWDRLADPDTEPPGVEPSLQSLLDEVKVVVQDESFIIKRAFPFYDEVLARFLQRVFQQSIQQRLEMVLEKANSISSLAFLRSLQAARSYISSLTEDLKAHGLTEHPEPVSSQIAQTLDQQLDELFVPYFMGSSYIEREKRNLEELYSSLLLKFTIYHARRRKMPTTYLGSLGQRGKELIASARDAYMDRLDSADLPASQRAILLRIAGVKDADHEKNKEEIEVTDEDGQLNLPNAKRMLKWLAEGVGRGLELSGGNETPKDVAALLNLLLTHMGETYIETALDAANENAMHLETSKNAPDLSYLNSLRTTIAVLHLMITTINTVLLPLSATNLTIRRDMDKTTNNTVARLEGKINTLLQKSIDVALSWITKLLAGQKKTDFRPRDDSNLALDELQTPTCLAVITFIRRLHSQVATSLNGRNLQLFLTELAIGVRSLLLEHFKKFQVSLTGGLIVSKDITKYTEVLRGLETEEGFNEGLEVLSEIGNIFVISPEALRDRFRGIGSGRSVANGTTEAGAVGMGIAGWEKGELRSYVLKRDDVGSVGVQAVLSAL